MFHCDIMSISSETEIKRNNCYDLFLVLGRTIKGILFWNTGTSVQTLKVVQIFVLLMSDIISVFLNIDSFQFRHRHFASTFNVSIYFQYLYLAGKYRNCRIKFCSQSNNSLLNKLAKKYLAISATSVSSERLFSKAGSVLKFK